MPSSSEDLLARVIVLTRRRYGEPPPIRPTLTIGELTVDITKRQVRVGSAEIQLAPLELNLLYLLAANAGRPVSRVEILGALWGTDFIAASNVVDRHVGALRLRLQDDPRRPRFIATVPGIGYRFIPAPTVDGAEC
jgi:DNA-binding response OmpR family regulator